jgi:hypothetical protein
MTTPTLTITDFLLARIAEDEAVALAADESGGGEWWQWREVWPKVGGNIYDVPDADQIARWSPARVLAECEAKRRIVAEHRATTFTDISLEIRNAPVCLVCNAVFPAYDEDQPPTLQAPWPCPTLRALASVYADHSDFREEWRA